MATGWAVRVAVTALACAAAGCEPAAEPERMQRGRVIDQDTGEPIAGAIVVGRYMGGMSWGGSSCNRAESAVSDAQGWFELPVDPKSGSMLKEAYKRGYDRGNTNRSAFQKGGSSNWAVMVLKWDAANGRAEMVRIEPELYASEAEALAASGEKANAFLRRSGGDRQERLTQLRLYQDDCAGPPRTTAGLAPFVERILAEQIELGERPDAIDISERRLERARSQAAEGRRK